MAELLKMVKSATSTHLHQEEEDDDVYEDLVARNDTVSYNKGIEGNFFFFFSNLLICFFGILVKSFGG